MAIAEQTDGPFALVNADILIPSGAELATKVASLGPGQMIIGRRLNLAQLGVSGTPYFYGYDFFAAHSADVTALGATQLVFGAPWWDHVFPLAMHVHGCQIEQLRPEVIHLNHDERWDLTTWMKLGDRFVDEMRPVAGDGEYARRLRRILGSDTNMPWEERRLALSRVGKLNLSVIDRLAPLPPSSGVRTPPRLRVQAALLRRTPVSEFFSSPDSKATSRWR